MQQEPEIVLSSIFSPSPFFVFYFIIIFFLGELVVGRRNIGSRVISKKNIVSWGAVLG